ncbi:TPA: hypothetical protein ACGPA6_001541 [Streptococcus suis]
MIKTTLTLLEVAIAEVLDADKMVYDDERYLVDIRSVGKLLLKQDNYYLIDSTCLEALRLTDSQKDRIIEYIKESQDKLAEHHDDFAVFLMYFGD